MVCATVLGLAVRQRIATDSVVPALVTGVAGLLVAGGAVAVWRWWPDRARHGGRAWLACGAFARGQRRIWRARPPRIRARVHRGTCGGVFTCGIASATRRYVNVAAAVVTLCGLGGTAAAGSDVVGGSRPATGDVCPGGPAVPADHGSDDRAVGGADPAALFRIDHRARPVPAQRRSTRGCGLAGR